MHTLHASMLLSKGSKYTNSAHFGVLKSANSTYFGLFGVLGVALITCTQIDVLWP